MFCFWVSHQVYFLIGAFKMKIKLHIAIFTLLFSCAALEEPESSISVEAYLYENRPVENIKLSFISPIENEAPGASVNNALVFIIWNNIYFQLFEGNEPGTYSLNNANLIIRSGNTYELLVRYNSIEIRGKTTVPITPEGLNINKDTLILNSSSDFIKVNWDNPNQLWHLGVIKETNSELTDFPFNNFFSLPTQESTLEITSNDVQILGNQQFILYGITEAYEDIYRISSSSIGSSNAGNLTNGFGIFAAFSSDTLNIVAIEK